MKSKAQHTFEKIAEADAGDIAAGGAGVTGAAALGTALKSQKEKNLARYTRTRGYLSAPWGQIVGGTMGWPGGEALGLSMKDRIIKNFLPVGLASIPGAGPLGYVAATEIPARKHMKKSRALGKYSKGLALGSAALGAGALGYNAFTNKDD